jgi:tellurite resistance protein
MACGIGALTWNRHRTCITWRTSIDGHPKMSLGLLVGRFANFVSEQPAAPEPMGPADSFPSDLMRSRDAFGHHVVPLLLLARCDGESCPEEREVILNHCLARAKLSGLELSLNELAALSDYLRDFRPSHAQLRPALKRLEHDSKDDIIALVAAAQGVVDADGLRRAQEVKFLEQLAHDLANL